MVQDEWIDFRRSAHRFPDGSVFEPYYSYNGRDYVVIVVSDEEGNYLCVRQFRRGCGSFAHLGVGNRGKADRRIRPDAGKGKNLCADSGTYSFRMAESHVSEIIGECNPVVQRKSTLN